MPTALAIARPRKDSIADFEVLVRKVRETLLLGRKRVREEMAKASWQAGKYIHEHVLHHRGRAKYGAEAILKLSKRVNVSDTTLERALMIYREFPKISSALKKLELTHLYALATIPDKKTRLEFAKRAGEKKWTTRKLESKIKKEFRFEDGKGPVIARSERAKQSLPLLIPKLGTLYTYRMRESKPIQANPGRLKVDFGFTVHRSEFKMRGKLKDGDIVESIKNQDGTYAVVPSKRGEKELFTYKAWVARVIDADTHYVEIDLGFGDDTEQYLRLRGIDCPEIETPEGKKAKAFVEECLRPAPFILLTSSRSDKFDRYLSDVFIPLVPESTVQPSSPESRVTYDGQDYLYLNNELLLRGLAVRVR